MGTHIALLRGINVGGNRKISMADLRTIFTEAGCGDVTTYIQSGNVVFTDEARSTAELKADLERTLEAATGFTVKVVLRTAEEWATVVDDNPYSSAEPTKLHVAFLGGDPGPDAAEVLGRAARGSEECIVIGRQVYLHLPDGMGRAELPKGLDKLGPTVTVRNWRTVTELLKLSR